MAEKLRDEPPYIKGKGKILNEKGEVIGYMTVAYNNPKYNPFINMPKSDGSSDVDVS